MKQVVLQQALKERVRCGARHKSVEEARKSISLLLLFFTIRVLLTGVVLITTVLQQYTLTTTYTGTLLSSECACCCRRRWECLEEFFRVKRSFFLLIILLSLSGILLLRPKQIKNRTPRTLQSSQQKNNSPRLCAHCTLQSVVLNSQQKMIWYYFKNRPEHNILRSTGSVMNFSASLAAADPFRFSVVLPTARLVHLVLSSVAREHEHPTFAYLSESHQRSLDHQQISLCFSALAYHTTCPFSQSI